MTAIDDVTTAFDSYQQEVTKVVGDLVAEVESVKNTVEDPAKVQALEDKIAAAKAAVDAADPQATATAAQANDPAPAGAATVDPTAAVPAQDANQGDPAFSPAQDVNAQSPDAPTTITSDSAAPTS